MRLQVLGCFGGDIKSRLPAFLINGHLLLDAGAIGIALSLDNQLLIDEILITHQHIDHLAGLPFYADAVFGLRNKPVEIYGSPEVLEHVHAHLFNGIMWPDFSQLPNPEMPTIRFNPVQRNREYSLSGGLSFSAFSTHHTASSFGYCIVQDEQCLIYTGDAGPSEPFWLAVQEFINRRGPCSLKAMIIECSFPEEMHEFAKATGHLTPALLRKELQYLAIPETRIFVFHMKPQHIDKIRDELERIEGYRITLLSPDMVVDLHEGT